MRWNSNIVFYTHFKDNTCHPHIRMSACLLPWIPLEKLDWDALSANPAAVPLLLQHPDKVNPFWLAKNPSPDAVPLIRAQWEQDAGALCADFLWANPSDAVLLVLPPPDADVDTDVNPALFSNPHAEAVKRILRIAATADNTDSTSLINWTQLSLNPHPDIIQLLEQNLDKVDWFMLSNNVSSGAMRILEQHMDRATGSQLSKNPAAAALLEKHPHRINWKFLSSNPAATRLFIEFGDNLDKINWDWAAANPHQGMLKNMELYARKLPQYMNWRRLSGNPGIFVVP